MVRYEEVKKIYEKTYRLQLEEGYMYSEDGCSIGDVLMRNGKVTKRDGNDMALLLASLNSYLIRLMTYMSAEGVDAVDMDIDWPQLFTDCAQKTRKCREGE